MPVKCGSLAADEVRFEATLSYERREDGMSARVYRQVGAWVAAED